MKKLFGLITIFMLFSSFSALAGKHYFNDAYSKTKAPILDRTEMVQKRVQSYGEITTVRYAQLYNGIEVWGGEIIKHYRNGKLLFTNGIIHDNIEVGTLPSLSVKEANEIVSEMLNNTEYKIRNTSLVIFPKDDVYFLAYKVDTFKFDSNMIFFVDAETGGILFAYENVKSAGGPPWADDGGDDGDDDGGDTSGDAGDVVGSGVGVLGQEVSDLHVYFDGSIYQAINNTRGAQIKTYVAKSRSLPGTLATDSDNYWTDGSVVDAHKYLENVYDFYYNVFGRKSYDNNNAALIATVHYGNDYVNAYWNGSQMVFGDGDGVMATSLAGAIDVIGHELSHAVTDATSDLIYYGESGALNEAFSDIMGTTVEFYWQPEGFGLLKADWMMGEDIWYPNEPFGDALRYLDDPHKATTSYTESGYYPAHYSEIYTGTSDNGGVHINCTVVGHWYYLIANGGTNSVSNITVTGMGIEKAREIVYLAFTQYMPNDADFSVARDVTLQAAADLYGSSSTEYNIVKTGWDAVGVE